MATPKRQNKKPGPVYFLSLEVEDLRCFGPNQILDLSNGNGRPSQWTIILGDNGVGKTTLLQSLAALAPVKDTDFSQYTGEHQPWAAPRYTEDYRLESIWKPQRRNRDMIALSGDLFTGAKLKDATSGNKFEGFYLTRYSTAYASSAPLYEELGQMICFGYGAARHTEATTLSKNERNGSVASLFSDNAALLNAEEWLLQADYSAHFPSSFQDHAKKQRDKVKEILIEILPDVTDIKFIPPSEEKMLPQIRVETPYGLVAIKDLSLGYRTLIAWMVDFARRMFELYPYEPEPLEQPAVVLIDEIDLHLHPKMQRQLINHLSNIFPNTQFIATAHSPLVVQAATNANIVLLRREGDHVVIDNNPQTIKGWRVDQILTSELFGLESARPPEYDAVLAERRKILSKARLTRKDKERLQELQIKVEALPAMETIQDVEAMDIIRRAADILKTETAKSNNDSHK